MPRLRTASALKWVLIVIVVLVALAVMVFLAFSRGMFGFDDWVVRKVVNVVETYIHPTIEFESFGYTAPYTVTLEGVTLVADDGTNVIDTKTLTIELAQRPWPGQPLVIEGVTLDQPNVRLIRYEQEDGSFGFRGLVPFVKADNIRNQEDQPKDVRLSEVFELRNLAITGGMITYDDDTGEPIVFRDIEMDADITEETNEQGDVLHAFAFEFGKEPLVDVIADGKLNLDAMTVLIDGMSFRVDLASTAGREALPPKVRELLGESDATGRLELNVEGQVDIRQPAASRGSGTMLLQDFFVARGDFQMPIQVADFAFQMEEGIASVTQGSVRLLGGEVRITDAEIDIDRENMPASVIWEVSDIDLHDLVREAQSTPDDPADPSNLYGIVSSTGAIAIRGTDPMASLDGTGLLNVTNAQLVAIPVLTDLFNAADLIGQLQGRGSHDDELDATFRIRPKGVIVDELMVSVPGGKFSGTGVAAFDQEIDFQLRGGPVEKMPLIGEAIGNITGNLLRYDIRGTISDPKVSATPLALGERDLEEGEDPLQNSVEEVLEDEPGVGEPGDGGTGDGDPSGDGGGDDDDQTGSGSGGTGDDPAEGDSAN